MVVKGRRLTLKEQWQKLKSELKGMTPREKLEHLWEYYKWVLAVFLGVVLIVATVISSIISLNTETIIAGTIINVPVDPEGYVMLQDGYYERAKTGGRQAVELTNMNFTDPYTTTDQTYAMDIMENVTAMVAADVLDYVMYDQVALPYFLSPDLFADLRNLFSEEELAAMGGAVIKLELEETGEQIPIAIDIRDTAFYQQHMDSEDPIFLSFSCRLPRPEACLDFWQYIKGGSTDSLQTVITGTVVDAAVNDAGKQLLSTGFFEAEGCTVGDHRVELTEQSFLPAPDYEGMDPSSKIKAHVKETLADSSLDYIILAPEALAELDKTALLDLSQILSAQQLTQLQDALIFDGERPVAVDLSTTSFAEGNVEGTAYLAFSANTKKLDICKRMWNYMTN